MKVTRAQQVLRRLREAQGEWVDGTELANEVVGGSEGLKRLRELRGLGWDIEERRHPNPRRAIWQYRLAVGARGPELTRPATPPVAPVPQGPTSPLPAGAPTSAPVPSSAEPRYECPKTMCDQTLRDVRATSTRDYFMGKCPRHGWQVVTRARQVETA
jgi:hypothetical protein